MSLNQFGVLDGEFWLETIVQEKIRPDFNPLALLWGYTQHSLLSTTESFARQMKLCNLWMSQLQGCNSFNWKCFTDVK
ncbi:hypothetical protein CV014_12820 [Nostoc sp. CMAA1605]|nr:hypothetical protein [Nostoc sp. CMAA1605]